MKYIRETAENSIAGSARSNRWWYSRSYMWGVAKIFSSRHSKGEFDWTPRSPPPPPGYRYAIWLLNLWWIYFILISKWTVQLKLVFVCFLEPWYILLHHSWFSGFMIYTILRSLALSCVNPILISTSCCNLYILHAYAYLYYVYMWEWLGRIWHLPHRDLRLSLRDMFVCPKCGC